MFVLVVCLVLAFGVCVHQSVHYRIEAFPECNEASALLLQVVLYVHNCLSLCCHNVNCLYLKNKQRQTEKQLPTLLPSACLINP